MLKQLWEKKYRLVSAGIILVILVFGAVGLKQYILNHQSAPQPLSTRGLPPPATDVPVVLPPDPGEAGKQTLEGIDSNHDGVRDDLEREIVYMYPQNDEVRRVLRAMMKKEQAMITTTGDHEHFKAIELSDLALSDCLNHIFSNDIENAHHNRDMLYTMLVNTPLRHEIQNKNAEIALPYAAEVGSVSACENVQGQY